MEHYIDIIPTVFEVYVAPLAAYSRGFDTGSWIAITDDEALLRRIISERLTACPYSTKDGDWAIHDYKGFYGITLGEHPSLKSLVTFVKILKEHGEMAAKLVDYFSGDVTEAVRHLRENYLGADVSTAAYAESLYASSVQGKIPDYVASYIDYEAMARDWELGGEIFTIELSAYSPEGVEQKTVHIFSNRPT